MDALTLVDNSRDTNSSWKPQQRKLKEPILIDENHPFDLDNYIAAYEGRAAIQRLIHIATVCPSLAPVVLPRAIKLLRHGREPQAYMQTVQAYNVLPSVATADEIELDKRWVEEIHALNLSDKNKLEVELKAYSSNMIKESIRMAHRDLGDYYRLTADHSNSLKHYTKSREFCTTGQHVLEMCLSVLELLVEQQNYSHISTYIFKADTALESVYNHNQPQQAGGSLGAAQAVQPPPTQSKKSPERDRVQTKLDFCTALANLGQGSFEKAAHGFLKLSTKGLEDWFGKLVTPSDIAVYGVLCALATLPRATLVARFGLSPPSGRSKGATSSTDAPPFAHYLEQEQYVRELVDAYIGSKFKTVLELLEKHSTRHLLDLHLYPHVHELTALIRSRALVLYFQPFAAIRLERMALAFGLGTDALEEQIIALIQAGDIKGRIDSQSRILHAKDVDERAALFTRAEKAGRDIQSADRKLLLRIRLMQADLIIKGPKEKERQQPMPQSSSRDMIIE